MSFKKGFTKKAGLISGAAKLVGKGIMGAGKGAMAIGGGPLNTGLTAMGVGADYSNLSEKMKRAAQR